jgi:predicted TIM-barrel fold metal-dependent hydrolase
MTADEYKLISVDDHIVEPPDLWTSRLPGKYQDAVPKVIELPTGRQAWAYEDIVWPISAGMVRTKAGVNWETLWNENENQVRFDEMRPGCYDPKARLADMDLDGVWAELAFPTFARFAGHRFIEGADRELSELCVRAYNDFQLEEWCATDPERLLPLTVLPLWDVQACVAEVERTAAAGAKAIAFSENPTYLGLPSVHSDHWYPLWAACQDAGLPVCMHIGSGTKLVQSSDETPWPAVVALDAIGTMMNCVDWLYSEVFDRFPGLKAVLSEGGAGWLPYVLERAEKVYDIHAPRIAAKTRPAQLFRDHMYVCIVTDDYALSNIDKIGEDNILWEADYPHPDGMFPNSRATFERSVAEHNIAPSTVEKIASGNARQLFRLG